MEQITVQITVNGLKVDLIRKNIKNINLSVYPKTGRVRVAAPLRTDDAAVIHFITSKLDWIDKIKIKHEGREKTFPPEYAGGETHYFQGMGYKLDVCETQGVQKVVLREGLMELYIKPGASADKKREILNKWYRAELNKLIPGIIARWEKIMNVRVNEVRVRRMKTRWGTCNIRRKRIWLNSELAKKPEACLEYVVVHEMIHFFERLHNEKYKARLSLYLPEWKQLKAELTKTRL